VGIKIYAVTSWRKDGFSARFIYLGNEVYFSALEQDRQLFWTFDFVFGL